jgi:predicted porin
MAAVTNGTLSDPRFGDNNNGKQISGRLAVLPAPGLIVGASAARGRWLDRTVTSLLPAGSGSYSQSALGADFEYSRDYWLVRSEVVWSRWRVPFAATAHSENLAALAMWVEGRYRLTPRIFLAARADRLGFSEIADGLGRRVSWDAAVSRIEANAGYYFQRNLLFRVAVQHNDRDGGRVLTRTYVSGQLAYWF